MFLDRNRKLRHSTYVEVRDWQYGMHFMCVYIEYVCAYIFSNALTCTSKQNQRPEVDIGMPFLYWFSTLFLLLLLFLKQILLLNLKLAISASLGSQQTPRIRLSPQSPLLWGYRHVPLHMALHGCWWSELKSLCFNTKYFKDQVIFLAQMIWILGQKY